MTPSGPRVRRLAIEKRGSDLFATMNAMPADLKQDFKVVWVGNNPRLLGVIQGKQCYMEKMYAPSPTLYWLLPFTTAR